jgi:hypothetical protein
MLAFSILFAYKIAKRTYFELRKIDWAWWYYSFSNHAFYDYIELKLRPFGFLSGALGSLANHNTVW